MNPTAELARKTARLKNARRATMIGAGCLALGMTLGIAYGRQMGLPLPERYQPVHATTVSGRAVTCYLGEDGKFRSVETGEPVQIRKWTTP